MVRFRHIKKDELSISGEEEMEERFFEITQERELLGILGIAAKTRKIIVGKDYIKGYLKSPKYTKKLLVIASDISEGQKKDWRHRGMYAGAYILQLVHTPKTLFAKSIGKEEVSTAAISDERLIMAILKKLGIPECTDTSDQ
jgi:ribosomal protein L30E